MVTGAKVKDRKNGALLRVRARGMRHDPTEAEKKFWWLVRDRRLGGFKFRRQTPVGRYIADFICIDARLIVELDGGQHAQRARYDAAREAFLAAQGFRVMRFWNGEVLKNPAGTAEILLRVLECGEAPSPQPSPPIPGAREQ